MRPLTQRLSPVIKGIVVLDALLFAFYALVKPARQFFQEHLALGPGLFDGELWQVVTHLFVHFDPVSFFFNIIGIWFVGAAIEQNLGRRRFLLVLFVPAVVGGVVTVALSMLRGRPELFVGSSLAVLGLFVAFGRIFWRTPTRVIGGLVIEARVLAAVLVGFALLADATRGSLAGIAGSLVAGVLAFALAGGAGPDFGPWLRGWRRRRSGRGGLEVIEGGRPGRPGRGGTGGKGPDEPRYVN